MRSWAYNRLGVLMGTSARASCPRWLNLRRGSLPMITLFLSQGDFYATAQRHMREQMLSVSLWFNATHRRSTIIASFLDAVATIAAVASSFPVY